MNARASSVQLMSVQIKSDKVISTLSRNETNSLSVLLMKWNQCQFYFTCIKMIEDN